MNTKINCKYHLAEIIQGLVQNHPEWLTTVLYWDMIQRELTDSDQILQSCDHLRNITMFSVLLAEDDVHLFISMQQYHIFTFSCDWKGSLDVPLCKNCIVCNCTVSLKFLAINSWSVRTYWWSELYLFQANKV